MTSQQPAPKPPQTPFTQSLGWLFSGPFVKPQK